MYLFNCNFAFKKHKCFSSPQIITEIQNLGSYIYITPNILYYIPNNLSQMNFKAHFNFPKSKSSASTLFFDISQISPWLFQRGKRGLSSKRWGGGSSVNAFQM